MVTKESVNAERVYYNYEGQIPPVKLEAEPATPPPNQAEPKLITDTTLRDGAQMEGMSLSVEDKLKIARKLDAIVAFAGIGEFLDTQVKRYSSGMNARLGFAIAAHLDPDVMIIDEVLSVGDAGYQDKCVRHMRGMVERGVPVVFVSHNLPAVIELCTRALVVRKGAVLFEGEPARAVHEYRQATWAEQPAEAEGSAKAMRIERVELLAGEERSLGVFETGGPMAVRIHYLAARPTVRPHFAVDIHRGDGVYCFGAGTFQRHDFGTVEGAGFAEIRFPRLTLLPGAYTLSVGIHRGDGQGLHDLKVQAYPFSVASDRRELGMVLLDHEWRHEPAAEPALPAGAAKGGPPR